jgi:hypothetical protein
MAQTRRVDKAKPSPLHEKPGAVVLQEVDRSEDMLHGRCREVLDGQQEREVSGYR